MRRGIGVLLLDRNFLAQNIISWRKAVDLVIGRQKADIIDIFSTSGWDPAVIVLKTWSPNPFSLFAKNGYAKSKVFHRDNYKCQYCSRACHGLDLTIDHIIPKSRGGGNSYTNCVTCCRTCNNIKDNLTPDEAGMRLAKEPKNITHWDRFPANNAPTQWQKWTTENYDKS